MCIRWLRTPIVLLLNAGRRGLGLWTLRKLFLCMNIIVGWSSGVLARSYSRP